MARSQFGLPRKSRLSQRRDLTEVFESGMVLKHFPFIVHVKRIPYLGTPFRMAVSVPKRKFRRAVDRNRVKRLVREAFRLAAPNYFQKEASTPMETVDLLFVYQGNKLPDFPTVSGKIILTLHRLMGEHETDRNQNSNSPDPIIP